MVWVAKPVLIFFSDPIIMRNLRVGKLSFLAISFLHVLIDTSAREIERRSNGDTFTDYRCSFVQNSYTSSQTKCSCNWGYTFTGDKKSKPTCSNSNSGRKRKRGCKFCVRCPSTSYVPTIDLDSPTQSNLLGIIGAAASSSVKITRCSINSEAEFHDWLNNKKIQRRDLDLTFIIRDDNTLLLPVSDTVDVKATLHGLFVQINVKCHTGTKYQDSCILMKFTGKRQYPLDDPIVKLPPKPSSSSPPVSIPSSSISHSATSTIQPTATSVKSLSIIPSSSSSSTSSIAPSSSSMTDAKPSSTRHPQISYSPSQKPSSPAPAQTSTNPVISSILNVTLIDNENKLSDSNDVAVWLGAVGGIMFAAAVAFLLLSICKRRRLPLKFLTRPTKTNMKDLPSTLYVNGKFGNGVLNNAYDNDKVSPHPNGHEKSDGSNHTADDAIYMPYNQNDNLSSPTYEGLDRSTLNHHTQVSTNRNGELPMQAINSPIYDATYAAPGPNGDIYEPLNTSCNSAKEYHTLKEVPSAQMYTSLDRASLTLGIKKHPSAFSSAPLFQTLEEDADYADLVDDRQNSIPDYADLVDENNRQSVIPDYAEYDDVYTNQPDYAVLDPAEELDSPDYAVLEEDSNGNNSNQEQPFYSVLDGS